ncbi:MAG: hypothetical protein WCG07_02345, partial [Candidatus Taylorbacteria bacterium]
MKICKKFLAGDTIFTFYIPALFAISIFFYSIHGTPIAKASTTNCYTYSPSSSGSTQSVTIYPSDGSTQNITINTQGSTLSILQPATFNVTDYSCGMWFDLNIWGQGWGALLPANFIASDGSYVPFTGSPFTIDFSDPSMRTTSGSGGYIGYLGWYNYDALSDLTSVAKEDALISSIDSTHTIQIAIGGGNYSVGRNSYFGTLNYNIVGEPIVNDYPVPTWTMSAPATNCVQLSGTGPISIAFIRGDGWSSNVSDFIVTANNIANQIKNIDPFKSYSSKLSFLVDLKKMSQSTLSNSGSYSYQSDNNGNTYKMYNQNASKLVRSNSSCNATVYITLINDSNMYAAWADPAGVEYLNLADSHFSNPLSNTFLGQVAT